MRRVALMALAVVLGVFLFQSIAFPAIDDPVKNLAALMKGALDSGKNPRDVVKDDLLAGNIPPDVFAVACRIGITLEDAIYGAIAAGVSCDVIARSAIGPCGTAAEVTRVLGDADDALAYGGTAARASSGIAQTSGAGDPAPPAEGPGNETGTAHTSASE